MELSIQLGIIFGGKQFFQSIVEYFLPKLKRALKSFTSRRGAKTSRRGRRPWALDFQLVEWGGRGLSGEYLEMVIQYGFVTIFVTAFPLAPLLALVNNVFELRVDAKKLLVHHRQGTGLP